MNEHCDIVILGAGAAGIGAARRLLQEDMNLKVIIIEARNRPGGRAWTSDELQSGVELDHGAKWIHGSTSQNPVNPMMELASQHGVATAATRRAGSLTRVVVEETDGNNTISHRSFEPGRIHYQAASLLYNQILCRLGPKSLISPVKRCISKEASYQDCFYELARREMPEHTFKEWLYSRAEKALLHHGSQPQAGEVNQVLALLRLDIYCHFESYEGCRLDQTSLYHGMCGTILPGGNADVAGGYGKLVQRIATSGVPSSSSSTSKTMDIRYNQHATSVVQTSDGIIVSANGPGGQVHRHTARLGCISAVPLGVLQHHGGLIFDPPLPERLTSSLSRLAMCLMNKIEILFPSRWWPEGSGTLNVASYASAGSDFPLGDIPWAEWIVENDDPAILVCYATGAFAEHIEAMTNEEVQNQAVEALKRAFMHNDSRIVSIPNPVCTNVTRWRSDPLSRGSWTFFQAGTKGMADVSAFQMFNVENDRNLYFAGEHTCDGSLGGLDIGTVHGAFLSGGKAAAELLRKNQGGSDFSS